MSDLLLTENPANPVEALGFAPIEMAKGDRWRWALGQEQVVRFHARRERARVHFRIGIPRAGMVVLARVGAREVLRAQGEGTHEGYFDLVAAGPCEVLFRASCWNEGETRFSDDARALAFCVSRFELAEPQPAVDPEAVARAVASGVAPPELCAVPFTHFYVNEVGVSYPCCELVLGVGSNQDEFAGVAIRGREDLPRAWNSPLQRSLRKQMLAGQSPAACQICRNSERVGANSLKQIFAPRVPDAMRIARRMDAEGNLPLEPQVFDFRLGNLCNLKCRMCHPRFSVGLVPEFTEFWEKDFSEFREVSWFKREGFLAEMAAFCTGVRELQVMGGEPFVIPEFPELLRELIRTGIAPKIRLLVTSNGTRVREEILELFPHFAAVGIDFSLDGVGAVNDYIRFPSRFPEIERNLRFVHENLERFNVQRVRINTTVQAYNALELPHLFRYLADTFPRFRWFPYLITLKFPEYLSAQALPAEEKRRVREKLEFYLRDERARFERGGYPGGDVTFAEVERGVRGVLGYMDAEDKCRLLPDARAFTEFFDRRRARGGAGPLVEQLQENAPVGLA